MAAAETAVVNEIMISLSKVGVFVWKNCRGMFLTLDGKRKIKAGLLAEGSGDLIGGKEIVITQDMVGTKILQLVSIEVKTQTGTVRQNQYDFAERMRARGGKAGIARSVEDAIKIIA